MKKKILLAVCAVTCATAMTVGFTACGDNNGNKGMSAEDAATKIATFTSSPNTVNATFKQTYKLDVNSDNAAFKAFEKDIADTVTIQADFTAGNVYYYGKKMAKDNSVTEQLVVKEDSTYYYLTTTTAKEALADEAAAKTKINELMTSLSKQTAGYVDSGAFVYSADWVNTYLLLGSNTIKGNEKNYFTYSYDKTEGDGLKVDINMQYVGYYGDAGTFEFGTDDTHKGAKASIETDGKGYITSFSQTLSNHLDMRISSTPTPLDLSGTRSLTATYNGTITKKTATDIEQDIPTTSTIVAPTVEHATIATYDFKQNDYSSLSTPSSTVTAGNFVAVKVTCDEDYEVVSVKVNGNDTQLIQGYYCLMQAATAGTTYNVAVVVKAEGEEAPTTGTIVVAEVEHATVKTYDFNLSNLQASLAQTSNTVTVGNFVAVKVECEQGYVLKSVKVNGTDGVDYSGGQGYYCVKANEAGTYNVEVTVVGVGNIEVTAVEHCTVKTYDFNLSDVQGSLAATSDTVTVGNFVAVKVECEAGYKLKSVTVNGTAGVDYSGGQGYYCVRATEAGATYTVVVVVEAE